MRKTSLDQSERVAAPASTPEPQRWRTLQRAGARALLPITMLLFATSLRYYIAGDGMDRYRELQALLSHGVLSAGKYSLIGPLFSTPLYLLGAALGSSEVGIVFFNVLLFLAGLLILRAFLRPLLDERTLRVFLLLLLVGSMFPTAAASYYGEMYTAIFVAVGLVTAIVGRRVTRGFGWTAIALGVANTPATLVGLALALAHHLWSTRRLRYVIVGVATAALILGEAFLRRGSIFATGYAHYTEPATILNFNFGPGFSYPVFFGLLGTFLSFGKGLIFFTPALFLPIRQRLAALGENGRTLATIYTLWMLFLAGMVIVYVKWWGWSGDWYWGPRFYLIACVPASFALALWTQRPSRTLWVNLLALGVLALTLWIGLDSAVFGLSNLAICGRSYYYDPICQFTPMYSPLWRPLSALYQLGFTQRYVDAELQYGVTSLGFALVSPIAGLYIAYPLLKTTWSQTRALLPSRAVALAALRRGWRW
ncbi:MAG TPA: hypothetical protein VF792_05870 [Ktedonobacterales bacterium]